MTDLLCVRDLRVHLAVDAGIVKAVDGVSFRVPQGRTVALVGESGSGKSIVAQTIMGILPRIARIVGGEVLFMDPECPGKEIDIAKQDPNGAVLQDIRGGRISIIFQEPMTALSPLHTIGNQIAEVLALHRGLGPVQRREAVVEILRLVGFNDPARAEHAYAFELSGGLRQRAMIAMALVCHPAMLIADEPTTALDVTIQAQILHLIQQLQGELHMAVLMITHDLGVVANMADEVVVMHRGRVMESGSVEDIFGAPGHPYLKALMRAVPRFDMLPDERLTPIREIEVEASRLVTGRPRNGAEGVQKPLLSVRGLSKRFASRHGGLFGTQQGPPAVAVADVSFDIGVGECLGLVGESGCGKTTTARILLRSVVPDSGEITYCAGGEAQDVLALKDQALFTYRRQVQFVFQDPFASLDPRMSVLDIIAEPLVIHNIGDADERYERVKELMRLVGLDIRYMRRYPHSFSGGQRQRIGIARALALSPQLLICDEPVSALDVSVQAQVLNLLRDLRSALNLAYLFITHNLAVVHYVADRVAVMCAGRIVEKGPRDALFANPVHPYTKALLAAIPYPDPARRLDFAALLDGRASDPLAWSEVFRVESDAPELIDIGAGHYVRIRSTADAAELRL